MILDASAVLAILLREPGYERPLELVAGAPALGIGTPTLVETEIVLVSRVGLVGRGLLAQFLDETRAVAVPFGELHWRAAVAAFVRYGRGRHPAGLNFGDCMTYATASLAGQPLLALGDDFAQTDLALA